MRLVASLIACLVVAGTFSGCTGEARGSTARSLLSTAQDAGAAWNDDAILVALTAFEARNGTELSALARAEDQSAHEGEIELTDHDDANPGDGRAPAWAFLFASKSANRTFDLVLDASGSTTWSMEGNATGGRTDGIALEQWKLDSDEAWQVATDKNATMRNSVAKTGTTTVTVLGQDATFGPHPYWVLIAEGPDHKDSAALIVDAENGTVRDFSAYVADLLRGISPTVRESGSISNILEPLDPSVDEELSLGQDGHGQLVIALSARDETPPGQRISLVLADPSGKPVLWLNHTRAVAAFDTPDHATLADPELGRYVATLELDAPGPSGLAATFNLSWCTDGVSVPTTNFGAPQPEACEFVVDQ